jgi:hypothetical protein
LHLEGEAAADAGRQEKREWSMVKQRLRGHADPYAGERAACKAWPMPWAALAT